MGLLNHLIKTAAISFLSMVLSSSLFSSCGGNSAPPPPAGVAPATVAPSPQASPAPGTAAAQPAQVSVTIPMNAAGKGPNAYGPKPLTITLGTIVTWTNQDTMAHTTTSEIGLWDSGALQPHQSFSFQFNQLGNYDYYCTIHGLASMSGAIAVSPSASPTASPAP